MGNLSFSQASRPRTTPLSTSCPEFVTITQPAHPLRGQRVEVVQRGSGIDPELIVKRADGRHFPVALSSTDAGPPDGDDQAPAANHLLELAGLRQVVRLLDRLAQTAGSEPEQQKPSQAEPTGPR